MSNRSYLVCTDLDDIYPTFQCSDFDPEEHTLLASDGCVPLLWLAGFAAGDLRTQEFLVPVGGGKERSLTFSAPVAPRAAFVKRLEGRRKLLNELFADNGGLDHAIDALVTHLRKAEGEFLGIEYEEYAATAPPGALDAAVAVVLKGLDAGDASCKRYLVGISTVLADLPFLSFDEAAKSKRPPDRWNVFRLLGGSWIAPAAWDHVDPQHRVHAMLNARRPRGTFALFVG